MVNIKTESLRAVPYLDADALEGRSVNLMPLWDGEKWTIWLPDGEGVVPILVFDARFVDYVAKTPYHESDLFVPFINLLWQRASYVEVVPLIFGIINDIHNLGTSTAKLHFFHQQSDEVPNALLPRFAVTEIEYTLVVTRSIFDLLQEIISRIWDKNGKVLVKQEEVVGSEQSKWKELPKTFSKMLLSGDKPRTKDELTSRYGIPEPLAETYTTTAAFFPYLRDARDRIVHGKDDQPFFIHTPRGFCVQPNRRPFDVFQGWQDSHKFNEDFVTVLPWLADIVGKTLDACNALCLAFAENVDLPAEIAPGFKVFVRAPTTEYLSTLLHIRDGASPWMSE